jgi:TolB protein
VIPVSIVYLLVISLSGIGSLLPEEPKLDGSTWFAHFPVAVKAYSADRIAFTRIVGQGEIYLMNPDGSFRVNLTNSPRGDGFGVWSPDGEFYAYESIDPMTYDSEVMVIGADGTGMINLSSHPAAHDICPTWSPDGSMVAFTSDRDGDYDIYLVNAGGTGLKRVTDHPEEDSCAYWSPLGDKLVFTSNRDGNQEIYDINPDGTQPRRLTVNTAIDELHPPSPWSPDGTRIAYASWIPGGFNRDIFLMNADGSSQVNLTQSPGVEGFPAWSPDGTVIAFDSDSGTDSQIYLIRPDGSGIQQLTNSPEFNQHPAWSPDGRKVAFVSTRDGNDEVYVMNADGSGQINITNDPESYDFDPTWRPR